MRLSWKKHGNMVAGLVGGMILAGGIFANSFLSKAAGSVDLNRENFPDDSFRQYVQENFDINQNGVLEEEEINSVISIDCRGKNYEKGTIKSLEGIENFKSLEGLYCDYNIITYLDLSNNTCLKWLNCENNELESLNIQNNLQLNQVRCGSNKLVTLDISKNSNLLYCYCFNNELESLDLKSNPDLIILSCGENKLKTLDVTNNTNLTSLSCHSNLLTNLDVSQNKKLSFLACNSNDIGMLDLSNNQKLKYLSCNKCNLNELLLDKNDELITLECSSNQLSNLNLRNQVKLQRLYCENNDLTYLNVEQNLDLVILSCYSNRMKEINISNCESLVNTKCNAERKNKECYILYEINKNPESWRYENYGLVDCSQLMVDEDLLIIHDQPTKIFQDVDVDKWFYNTVNFAKRYSYMNGKKDANGNLIFAPNDKITRAEFATVLYNKENKPDTEYKEQFSDVQEGKWYTKPVVWAFAVNIAKGYANSNKYGVSDDITREQLAQMLFAYAKYKGIDVTVNEDVTLDRFADADKVSNWALTALKWATSRGVINGSSDAVPKLNPKGKATRAECAAMIKNFVEKVENAEQD